MSDIYSLTAVGFTIEAGLLLMFVGFLAYQRKNVPAFAVLLAAGLSGVFGQLDHISEVSASATNLTIRVREASDALKSLRKIAITTGIALVRVDDSLGLYGPDTAIHRDKLKKDVIDLLRSTGVQQQDMEPLINLQKDDDKRDYLAAIKRHVGRSLFLDNNARRIQWDDEFERNDQLIVLTPKNIEDLFVKYNVNDSFSRRLLADFSDFVTSGQHANPEFWANRDQWPDNKPPSVVIDE